MAFPVSRRTTEASRASEARSSETILSQLDLASPSWALDWDVFAMRYGDPVDTHSSENVRGAESRHHVIAAPAFEYVRPADRSAATSASSTSSTPPRSVLASILRQTREDCSAWWMVSASQQHAKKHHERHKRKNPRQLFQYKPYETQEPLRLSEDEMAGVVSAVFSGESSELSEARDAGIVILIKVVMDIFLEKGGDAAFGQVASLLRKPLVREDASEMAQCSVFDVIVNLMIHGELLYGRSGACEAGVQGAEHTRAAAARESVENDARHVEDGSWMSTVKRETSNVDWMGPDSNDEGHMVHREKKEAFRAWLRRILFDMLDALVGSRDGSAMMTASVSPALSMHTEVWSSALSCVLSLCTKDGFVVKEWVDSFPLPALKRMLLVARKNFWATSIQALLACIACNVMYSDPKDCDGRRIGCLNQARLDGFGGVSSVVKEYQYAPTGLACTSLFCVLLDSVGTMEGVSKAMLRCGAAEFLRDYLVLPSMKTDEDVNENLARAIHGACLAFETPPDSRDVEFDDILQCIRSLKHVASGPGDVPQDLATAFEATLEAGVFGQTSSQHWKTLRSLLLSESPQERVVGRSWMVKLMMSVLDACVTDPKEKNAIIPPPVPLLPSDAPERTLFTFGDVILSVFTQDKARKGNETGKILGNDDMVTNFALAVRQVVGGIRFRTLNIGGNLHTKWTAGGVDPDRLCISTLERAFEWIMRFSSAAEWSSAIALVVESMIVVATGCSKMSNAQMSLGDRRQPPSTPTGDSHDGTAVLGSALASESRSQHQTPDCPGQMAPLHIPSPSSTGAPDSTGPLSPLTKIVPGLWRRLKTPGSSRTQGKVRPHSAESQSSNPDNTMSGSGGDRPLSAGVMAMDAGERERDKISQSFATSISIQVHDNNSLNGAKYYDAPPASRVGSVMGVNHNTQWVSLADRVAFMRDRNQKDSTESLASIHATILAYHRTVDPIESFVTATSTCTLALLDMLSPQTLKDVFDAMSQVDGVQRTIRMAGKPFWDARLAAFILLVSSYTKTGKNRHNHPLIKDTGYVQSLIRDPDLRVRHHACAFLLHRLCESNRDAFIKATRAIVSWAQQSDDVTLLTDPEQRVRKMMDLGIELC